MEYDYLLTIAVILASTKVCSIITGKLQLPQVVGSLLAGLLLGPAFLGVLQPSPFLSKLSELGVIVIMFSAGMGTSLSDLKKSGGAGFLVALLGVLVPLGGGALLTWGFNPGYSVMQCIFMGTVLTATSVSITVETLKEIGRLSTRVGNTILAAALIDDVLGLICLTVVCGLSGESVNIGLVLLKIVLFFVFALVMGFAFNRFMVWYDGHVHDRNLHRFPVAAFALCLFMAWAAETLFGVADIIGAFAAGLIVATTPKGTYIQNKFSPISYLLLTPIFFANIGLEVALPDMTAGMAMFTALLVVVAVVTKLVGCGMGAKLCGFSLRQCIQTGCGMACRGEVALIVANRGVDMGMIDPKDFGPIVILIVCCAVLTPVMLKAAFKGEDKYEGLEESALLDHYEAPGQLDAVNAQLLERDRKHRKTTKQ